MVEEHDSEHEASMGYDEGIDVEDTRGKMLTQKES